MRRAYATITGTSHEIANNATDLYVDAGRPKKFTNTPLRPASWSATKLTDPPRRKTVSASADAPNLLNNFNP